MRFQCRPFGLEQVQLLPGLFKNRFDLNLSYVMSLRSDNLLQNFYLEAAIRGNSNGALRSTMLGDSSAGDDRHWGWESPTCELRGHFLGHWLSAAARIYKSTGSLEVKLKADHVGSASHTGHNAAGTLNGIGRWSTLNRRLVNGCAPSAAYPGPHWLPTRLLPLQHTPGLAPPFRPISVAHPFCG